MMKSTLGKAVKPGASTLSMGKSNQASTIGGRRGGAEGGAGQADPDSRDKKKQEDMKQQKKEETSEERFMKVIICEEESTNLKRVFKLFVYEQQVLTKEGKGKKELGRKDQTRKDWNKKEGSQDGADDSRLGNVGKDPIESIDWFDSKAVRVILGRLGVKDIREQDIEIMIWVTGGLKPGSR